MNGPTIADDGTHIIPVHQICYSGRQSHPSAVGELRWHPEKGATFIVQFPNVSGLELPKYFGRPAADMAAGRIQHGSKTPQWTAQTADGLQVEIFELNAIPTSMQTTGTAGFSTHSSVNVEVTYASVDLSKDNQLSFWHQTPAETRMLCLGFSSRAWHKTDEITYPVDDAILTTGRGILELSTTPRVQQISAGRMNLPDDVRACWLVTEQPSDGRVYPNAAEQGFVSFLNGKRTPFVWHDSFVDSTRIRRVYYGWHRHHFDELKTSCSQPLPLYGTVESLRYADKVILGLPSLFSEFAKVFDAMQLTWILNPLWGASGSILNDQFALICISLERLAQAWQEKKAKAKRPPFFSATQQDAIREAIWGGLDLIWAGLGLNEDQESVLRKKIANICAPPNADKLEAVFTDLGIALTPEDKEAIKKRNTPFHGQPTLGNPNDLDELNKEVDRCDRLRMLLTKAVLTLLKYRGPIMNYSSRSTDRVELL